MAPDNEIIGAPTELRAICEEHSIPVHEGGFHWDPIAQGMSEREVPTLALMEDSEIPSAEELDQLVAYAALKTESFGGEVGEGGYAYPGANMMSLRKTSEGWQYRKLTWVIGPTFTDPMPLEDIFEREGIPGMLVSLPR